MDIAVRAAIFRQRHRDGAGAIRRNKVVINVHLSPGGSIRALGEGHVRHRGRLREGNGRGQQRRNHKKGGAETAFPVSQQEEARRQEGEAGRPRVQGHRCFRGRDFQNTVSAHRPRIPREIKPRHRHRRHAQRIRFQNGVFIGVIHRFPAPGARGRMSIYLHFRIAEEFFRGHEGNRHRIAFGRLRGRCCKIGEHGRDPDARARGVVVRRINQVAHGVLQAGRRHRDARPVQHLSRSPRKRVRARAGNIRGGRG